MGWIFAIVILLLIVFVPTVRKIALLLIVVIGVVVMINISDDDKKKKAKEAEEVAQSAAWAAQAPAREKLLKFPLTDVSLSETALNLQNGGTFSGRIHNNSTEKALGSVAIKLSISDCETSDLSNCVVVGERDIYLSTTVPNNQARDFSKGLDFYMSPMVIRGYMKIDSKLVQASQ